MAIAVPLTLLTVMTCCIYKFGYDLSWMWKTKQSQRIRQLSSCDIVSHVFCEPYRIIFGYFSCRWCCCKVSYGSQIKEEERYEIKDWNLFINKETIPITQVDLHDMRQKFIKSRYNHKYYCFKNAGERCNHSQCFHYETIKWKGLLQYPVLYLLVLNYGDTKESYKVMIALRKLITDNNHLNWLDSNDNPLEFIFKVILKENLQGSTEFEGTKGRLKNKINNICLVLEDFPREYSSNFQDEEKFTLELILRLQQYYKVPLMYRVR